MKESLGLAGRVGVAAVAVALAATLAAGCGDEAGETVEVLHPPEDAVVSLPFDVTLDASVTLGAVDGDRHHVHIWFGNDLESYLVVEANEVEIVTAPIGAHDMHVSLRKPDHTSAGADISVPLVITGG